MKRLIRRFVPIVGGVVLALAAAELYVAYAPAAAKPPLVRKWLALRPQRSPQGSLYLNDKETGWRLAPGISVTANLGDPDPPFLVHTAPIIDPSTSLPIEEVGVRMPVHQGKTRALWLALGDSQTMGGGVADEEAWPHVLEAKLGGQVSVINAGVIGYGTDQAVQWLKKYGRRLRPTRVLLGFLGANDVDDNAHQIWKQKKVAGGLRRYLKAHSAALFLLSIGYGELKKLVGVPYDVRDHYATLRTEWSPLIQQGWQNTEVLLLELKHEVEASGGEFTVVYIPWGVEIFANEAILAEAKAPLSAYTIPKVRDMTADFCRRHKIQFIDLTAAIKARAQETELYFGTWRGHWTPAGHALAADVITTALKQHGAE